MSTIQEFEEAAAKATQASAQADTWANGAEGVYVETDSGPVPTIAEFTRANQVRADSAIDALGWVLAGDFTAGCTVTDRNQYVLVVGGAGYRWDGTLPKVVAPGSSPTPIATGAWVLVGDATLRGDLAAPDGSELVGFQQSGIGAVARTAESKLREFVSVKDFGADNTGATDSTNAIIAGGNALSAAGGGVLTWPSGTYNYTFNKPPYGVTWDMHGPNITRASIGGSSTAVKFQTARLSYMDGPHTTHQLHANHFRAVAKGSNAIGAQYADYGLGIAIEKENWSETSGVPVAGEINGLTIMTRNGCATGDPVKTGGAAILADIGQTAGSGYTQFAEIANSVFAKGSLSITRQTNMQLLGIDEKTGDSWAVAVNSISGSQSGVMRIMGTDSAPWNYIFQSWKNGRHVFYTSDLGKFRWRINGISMSQEQDAATGAIVQRAESGAAITWTSPTGQAGLRAVNVQSVAAYTIDVTEITGDLGKTVVVASATPATVTLPNNAPLGFHCEIIQREAGQITFSAAAGATLQNVDGHTKTKGQHAIVRLRVRGNVSGTAAIWVMDGSTSA